MGARVNLIKASDLYGIFSYDENTGILKWLKRPTGKCGADLIAGTICSSGHRQIAIKGKKFMAHRIAWAMFFGSWPKDEIDHKNCMPDDNRIQNLRECTDYGNNQNKKTFSSNTSGYKGVSWYKNLGKWVAHIGINKKKKCLGYFESKELAYEAYCAASKFYHGEFSRID